MKESPYLIVGAGLTGDAACRGIRELDAEGEIVLVGAEPHPPYARPPLSKALWKGKSEDTVWRGTEALGVDVRVGRRIVALDLERSEARDDQGESYRYEKLLLAPGVRPRRLPFGGDDVIYFRTLDDYRRLRVLADRKSRVVVIGGGFIGSEIAAALTLNGCAVTMVFPEPGIGARIFPPALSAAVDDYYRGHGVEVLAASSVTDIERGRVAERRADARGRRRGGRSRNRAERRARRRRRFADRERHRRRRARARCRREDGSQQATSLAFRAPRSVVSCASSTSITPRTTASWPAANMAGCAAGKLAVILGMVLVLDAQLSAERGHGKGRRRLFEHVLAPGNAPERVDDDAVRDRQTGGGGEPTLARFRSGRTARLECPPVAQWTRPRSMSVTERRPRPPPRDRGSSRRAAAGGMAGRCGADARLREDRPRAVERERGGIRSR